MQKERKPNGKRTLSLSTTKNCIATTKRERKIYNGILHLKIKQRQFTVEQWAQLFWMNGRPLTHRTLVLYPSLSFAYPVIDASTS